MFITLKHKSYEEQIPFSSVLKFSKSYSPEKYEITLTEIFTTRDFSLNSGNVKNRVIEIDMIDQPLAFDQIKNYLDFEQIRK